MTMVIGFGYPVVIAVLLGGSPYRFAIVGDALARPVVLLGGQTQGLPLRCRRCSCRDDRPRSSAGYEFVNK